MTGAMLVHMPWLACALIVAVFAAISWGFWMVMK